LKHLFQVDYLSNTWNCGKKKLCRAEKLYTGQNYRSFLESLSQNFPEYVYYCPFRQKKVISAPLSSAKEVFLPKQCLSRLTELKNLDSLQEKAISLVNLLSTESGICFQDFGIHGSIALNMHRSKSDIDLVVYGAQNFRHLETTINALVEAGTLSFKFNNRLDQVRCYKGKYQNATYMYNAVRRPEEIDTEYGELRYSQLFPVRFVCRIRDDSEAMFRPAIYRIEEYEATDASSSLAGDRIPELLISMIGCYRNVARKGDLINVSGMLERAENIKTGRCFHQVVVGTALSEEEHIWPLQL
jgi:predicted nucleotidyltransferase